MRNCVFHRFRTQICDDPVSLLLRAFDLLLQVDQLVFVLRLHGVQTTLTQLELLDQLLLDGHLALQVCQVLVQSLAF